MKKYIKKLIECEYVVKKSIFLCKIYPVKNVDEVNNILKQLKEEHKRARHITYAYIIDDVIKMYDDNEPSNTAGQPIYEVLHKNNLNYVFCVVIRYFGGIKLGASGLTKAYSNSVSECLKKATLNTLVKGFKISITCELNELNKVIHTLNKYGIIECEKFFTSKVFITFDIKEKYYTNLLQDLKKINYKIQYEELSEINLVEE